MTDGFSYDDALAEIVVLKKRCTDAEKNAVPLTEEELRLMRERGDELAHQHGATCSFATRLAEAEKRTDCKASTDGELCGACNRCLKDGMDALIESETRLSKKVADAEEREAQMRKAFGEISLDLYGLDGWFAAESHHDEEALDNDPQNEAAQKALEISQDAHAKLSAMIALCRRFESPTGDKTT